MNPLSLIFGGVVEAGKAIFGQWMETKRTKIIAQQALQTQIQKGEIDYNVAAQQGMAASFKDELVTIWMLTVMSFNFVPSMQPYMKKGWEFMQTSTPDWFAWAFVGMIVAIYGLKGYKGWKSNGS
jgi:hypothetical protein